MIDYDMDRKYGLDGQEIYFPSFLLALNEGDIITQGEFKLRNVGHCMFEICSSHDFITGEQLLKGWDKLELG
jgi:hypothetical protein